MPNLNPIIPPWRYFLYIALVGIGVAFLDKSTDRKLAPKPRDAAQEVQIFGGDAVHSTRYGDLDFIACQVLRPYPKDACTVESMTRITHLVICERGLMEMPHGWTDGRVFVNARDARPRPPWRYESGEEQRKAGV